MNRGVDRQPVFFNDADRLDFGRQLAWIHESTGGTVLAYCLMGNHYHLLLDMPDGTLSEAMHHLGSVYTRHVNDRLGRDGPLFRGRFHSIPVEDDAYLLTAVRYIHRNPIGLPGVSGPADHRWSSYRTYLGSAAHPGVPRHRTGHGPARRERAPARRPHRGPVRHRPPRAGPADHERGRR